MALMSKLVYLSDCLEVVLKYLGIIKNNIMMKTSKGRTYPSCNTYEIGIKPAIELYPNIEYILGLMDANENRTHLSQTH